MGTISELTDVHELEITVDMFDERAWIHWVMIWEKVCKIEILGQNEFRCRQQFSQTDSK